MAAWAGFVEHVGDEAAVDLELVDRQRREVAERGLPHAEVVDADPHAGRGQLGSTSAARAGSVISAVSVISTIRRSAAPRPRCRAAMTCSAKPARPRLRAETLTATARSASGSESRRSVSARAQHPPGQPVDEVGLLGQRDEPVGGRAGRASGAASARAPRRRRPGRRRGSPWAGSAGRAGPSSMAWRSSADQREVGRVVVVLGRVVADDAGVLGLGHVHRHVGQLQQLVDVGAVLGGDRRSRCSTPPTAGSPLTSTSCSITLAQPPQDLLGVVTSRQDHPELVAAQPGDGVRPPDARRPAVGASAVSSPSPLW